MVQVLDYSGGFPGAQNIKNKGYVGAVRYIGRSGNPKNTTKSELLDFTNRNIGMALVFEGAATDWRGGFGAGQVNGRASRDHANSIGFPANRPIYMAVDQDVVRSGEFATMVEYLRGAGTSLGGSGRTGVYGEADVIDRARSAGVASWFWQTAAWSGGRRTTAHLFQRIGTVSVGDVACDVNDVLQADWGQHNLEVDLDADENRALNESWRTLTKFDDPGPDGDLSRRFIKAIATEIFNMQFTREGEFPRDGQPETMTLKGVVQYFPNNTDDVRNVVGEIKSKIDSWTPGSVTPEQLQELQDLTTEAALNEASRRLAGE